jgi:cobalamin biosynthesis Mg chelatase CobN
MKWFRQTRGSGRSALLLSSVLALLAFACVPVAAQADSGEVEYENALPKADGNGPSQNEQIAEKSDSPKNGGAEAPANSGSNGSGEGGSYTEVETPSEEEGSAAGTGNGNGGSGQGKPDQSANPSAKAGVQDGAPLTKASPASSGDGSSPLVPILIAIAVLAAISIAAVMIRQRRQRDGSSPSLSTKVG